MNFVLVELSVVLQEFLGLEPGALSRLGVVVVVVSSLHPVLHPLTAVVPWNEGTATSKH